MARVDLRTEIIGVDEAQFLGMEMIEVAVKLAGDTAHKTARKIAVRQNQHIKAT